MSARQPWAAGLMEIRLRAVTPLDREPVARFLAAMDREGLYQRHFAHGDAPNLALLARLAASDGRERVGLIAVGPEGEVLGHAEYVATAGSAEYALMLLPRMRGRGLGRRMLAALLEIATEAGQHELHGIIQAGNTPALQLSLRMGFRVIPGEDRTVVIVSRELTLAAFTNDFGADASPDRHPNPDFHHDSDRTSLHSRLGSGAPFRSRRGQVQCFPADAVGGGQEARG